MSAASFPPEEELDDCEYDVSIPLKVIVDFSTTDLGWKVALREEVRKRMIEHISKDVFGFEFSGPHAPE